MSTWCYVCVSSCLINTFNNSNICCMWFQVEPLVLCLWSIATQWNCWNLTYLSGAHIVGHQLTKRPSAPSKEWTKQKNWYKRSETRSRYRMAKKRSCQKKTDTQDPTQAISQIKERHQYRQRSKQIIWRQTMPSAQQIIDLPCQNKVTHASIRTQCVTCKSSINTSVGKFCVNTNQTFVSCTDPVSCSSQLWR